MSKIRTAVFPVAGRGTRFLPATKASPKEMLPIVDRPLIQYAVDEAIAAGARAHFDTDAELERQLAETGKDALLALVKNIPTRVTCMYVRQGVPLGLGHAVLCARDAVGNEPFFVHLADDLIHSDVPCLRQMSDHFERHGASVLGVETVPRDQTGSYGIVAVENRDGAQRVTRIVEKPKPAEAPSTLAVVGRYILTPKIFAKLERTQRGAGGEIQLTDGIASLLAEEPVYAFPFAGIRYDCGSKIGYLRATVEYALRHQELGPAFRAYLQGVLER
jgi:UTP--glucose-1-phosphate uridylyltransferase